MIKTAEYFVQNASARSPRLERFFREWKRLSVTVAVYLLLVVIAVVVGKMGEYDLAGESVNGFALWFLMLPAYPLLCIAGGVCWIFEVTLPFAGHEALLLGIADAVTVLLVYAVILLIAYKKRRPFWIENTRHFLRILIFWGIFQLGCCAVRGAWKYGHLNGLHNKQSAAAVTPDQR